MFAEMVGLPSMAHQGKFPAAHWPAADRIFQALHYYSFNTALHNILIKAKLHLSEFMSKVHFMIT